MAIKVGCILICCWEEETVEIRWGVCSMVCWEGKQLRSTVRHFCRTSEWRRERSPHEETDPYMQVLRVPARTAALMQPIAGLEVPVPASCTLEPVGAVVSSICHTKQESVPRTSIEILYLAKYSLP